MRIISIISIVAITALNLGGVVNAKNKSTDLIEKSVYAKCFVELVGGSETISFWLVKPSAIKTLSQNIVGKEILHIANSQQVGSNKKVIIYKAKQCVLEEGQFSSSRARAIDKELEL